MLALLELVAVALLEQLVVRRAGDDLDLELRNRLVVDDRAERARREDVGLHAVDLVGADGTRAELVDDALHALGVDVGDDELRARLVQLLREVVADVPAALHRDRPRCRDRPSPTAPSPTPGSRGTRRAPSPATDRPTGRRGR